VASSWLILSTDLITDVGPFLSVPCCGLQPSAIGDPKLVGVFEDMQQFSIRGEFVQLRAVVEELQSEEQELERALEGVPEDLVLPDFRPRLEKAARGFLSQVESAVDLQPEDRENLEVFVARLLTAPTVRDAVNILEEGYTTTREREFISHVPLLDVRPGFVDEFVQRNRAIPGTGVNSRIRSCPNGVLIFGSHAPTS
jgi:hypothetical protein